MHKQDLQTNSESADTESFHQSRVKSGEATASATGDNYGHMTGAEANGFTVSHTINSNNVI